MQSMSLDQFRAQFRGHIIQPTDADYESARKVYNAMIDKRPRLIARCTDVADIIYAVNFGRDNGLLTAVRGGGHNGGGLGICDDGLVIDLSRMKGVQLTLWRSPPKWRAVASGVMWTMPRTPSAWLRPAVSSRPLGSRA